MNGIAIVVIEDEDVVAALAGWKNEVASLIRVCLAGCFVYSRVAGVDGVNICMFGGWLCWRCHDGGH